MQNWPQRRSAGADRDTARRMSQVKEMVRLGAALRAEMGLNRIFTQVVESISLAIGFHVAALNIVRSDSEYLEVVATAGLSPANQRELSAHPPHLPALIAAMRPEFCRSRSYFIPHQYRHILDAVGGVVETPQLLRTNNPDAWDPEDVLLVPLVSPRTGRLLGVLSLDQPEDGLIPSLETIEIIELFANQAALAIDTSRIFTEREMERQALAQGLRRLRYHLDLARDHDLRQPAPPLNSILDPLVVSFNEVLNTFNDLLSDAQSATEMVNQHASEVRAAATFLSEGSAEQAERILELRTAMDSMTFNVQHIATTAEQSSSIAHDASDLSRAGSESAALASEGMASVRELTLQTKKKVKRLGESAQEIGDIVQLVEEIASKTNLLALNASIEAARASEHGRGFAVVAQEIRRLATTAADATRQIHQRIQVVQNETNQVVVQIEHSVEQVVLQSELVTQAGAALNEVDKLNQHLATDVQQINDIASEQAKVATQVALAITELAGVSTQTSDSMEQARASMDYLVDLAATLQRQLSAFHLRQETQGQPAPTSPRLPTPPVASQTIPLAPSPRTYDSGGLLNPQQRAADTDPATLPMANTTSARLHAMQVPVLRSMQPDTVQSPAVTRGSGGLGSGGLGSGGLGSGQGERNSQPLPSAAQPKPHDEPAGE